jgi:hypothetical protein
MTTTLSANPATVGSSVTDQTTISGLVNPTSLGTIEFYWYTGSSCSTGQNAAGNPFHVNTDGIFGSGSVVFNTTGSYSWNAVYSGDANNNAATSACELLTVQKASPSITTTLSHTTILTDGEGGSVFDSATVSGGQNPTGNVNFFYKVPCPPASGGIGVGGNVPLSGGSATSDTLGFGTAGTLYYYAVYSGDANNNPATSACEALTIVNQKASPSITTTLFRTEGQPAATTAVGGSVFDSAHLAGATSSAGGTVQYELFSNGSCTGTPTNIFAPVPVNIGIAPNSAPQTFNTAGSFSWKAVYSGDLNNNGITSACEVLTVTSGGFSIPEFPLQPVLSVLVTVLMVSAYVIVRRKAVGARGLRPSG